MDEPDESVSKSMRTSEQVLVGTDEGEEVRDGAVVGSDVGSFDSVGTELDVTLGVPVGERVGSVLGLPLGEREGSLLGDLLGVIVGSSLGDLLGDPLGDPLGDRLGIKEGSSLGDTLGTLVGAGLRLGDILGNGVLNGIGGPKFGVCGSSTHRSKEEIAPSPPRATVSFSTASAFNSTVMMELSPRPLKLRMSVPPPENVMPITTVSSVPISISPIE